MLQGALAGQRQTPESVDAATMSHLLRGRILKELEQILPRGGLKRQLEALAAALPKAPAPEKVEAEEAKVGSSPKPEEQSGNQILAAPAQVQAPPPVSAALASPAAVATLPTPQLEAAETPKPASRELEPQELERLVLAFAQLAEVKLVAAIRAGKIVCKRGGGMDITALSRLGPVALKLLRRSGELRSFYLAHDQGQFFMLPFGHDTIVVFASQALNVGTLFTTLKALKEEL
jgi:hypothetical protein